MAGWLPSMGALSGVTGELAAYSLFALGVAASTFQTLPALAVEQAAAQGPALNIALLVSSRADECFDRGDIGAITRMTAIEEARINAKGGVAGRPIKLQLLDDKRDQEKLNANIATALDDPNTLAIVGLTSNTAARPPSRRSAVASATAASHSSPTSRTTRSSRPTRTSSPPPPRSKATVRRFWPRSSRRSATSGRPSSAAARASAS